MNADIKAYHAGQEPGDRKICELLAAEIDKRLPESESKIWHRHPVWFLDGNPREIETHQVEDPETIPLRSQQLALPPSLKHNRRGCKFTGASDDCGLRLYEANSNPGDARRPDARRGAVA